MADYYRAFVIDPPTSWPANTATCTADQDDSRIALCLRRISVHVQDSRSVVVGRIMDLNPNTLDSGLELAP
jgi:hypothetical protein